jgi:hypothetical protein
VWSTSIAHPNDISIGTGKTYTMLGYDFWSMASEDMSQFSSSKITTELRHSMGIIPRSMIWIFQKIATLRSASVNVSVSYVEIYNEKLVDLLNINPETAYEAETNHHPHPSSKSATSLDIRETRKGEIVVAGLTQVHVRQIEEVMEVLWSGAQARSIASTDMNEHSSRSHTIFQVQLEIMTSHSSIKEAKKSKLCLVDLAGSEKWRGHQVAQFSQERIKEFTSINKSLSALGNCISALMQKSTRGHIPYRDSKLTRLLQDSLGGNTRTLFIVTLSPSSEYVDETVSTLQFADRAMKVRVQATVNKEENTMSKKMLIDKYNGDIAKLKKVIAMLAMKFSTQKKLKDPNMDDMDADGEDELFDLEDILSSAGMSHELEAHAIDNAPTRAESRTRPRTMSSSSLTSTRSKAAASSTSRPSSPKRSSTGNYDMHGRKTRPPSQSRPAKASLSSSQQLMKRLATKQSAETEEDEQSLDFNSIYSFNDITEADDDNLFKNDHDSFQGINPKILHQRVQASSSSSMNHPIEHYQLISNSTISTQSSPRHLSTAQPNISASTGLAVDPIPYPGTPTPQPRSQQQLPAIEYPHPALHELNLANQAYVQEIKRLEARVLELEQLNQQQRIDFENLYQTILSSNRELKEALTQTQHELVALIQSRQQQPSPASAGAVATAMAMINVEDFYHRMQSMELMMQELRDNISRANTIGLQSPYLGSSLRSTIDHHYRESSSSSEQPIISPTSTTRQDSSHERMSVLTNLKLPAQVSSPGKYVPRDRLLLSRPESFYGDEVMAELASFDPSSEYYHQAVPMRTPTREHYKAHPILQSSSSPSSYHSDRKSHDSKPGSYTVAKTSAQALHLSQDSSKLSLKHPSPLAASEHDSAISATVTPESPLHRSTEPTSPSRMASFAKRLSPKTDRNTPTNPSMIGTMYDGWNQSGDAKHMKPASNPHEDCSLVNQQLSSVSSSNISPRYEAGDDDETLAPRTTSHSHDNQSSRRIPAARNIRMSVIDGERYYDCASDNDLEQIAAQASTAATAVHPHYVNSTGSSDCYNHAANQSRSVPRDVGGIPPLRPPANSHHHAPAAVFTGRSIPAAHAHLGSDHTDTDSSSTNSITMSESDYRYPIAVATNLNHQHHPSIMPLSSDSKARSSTQSKSVSTDLRSSMQSADGNAGVSSRSILVDSSMNASGSLGSEMMRQPPSSFPAAYSGNDPPYPQLTPGSKVDSSVVSVQYAHDALSHDHHQQQQAQYHHDQQGHSLMSQASSESYDKAVEEVDTRGSVRSPRDRHLQPSLSPSPSSTSASISVALTPISPISPIGQHILLPEASGSSPKGSSHTYSPYPSPSQTNISNGDYAASPNSPQQQMQYPSDGHRFAMMSNHTPGSLSHQMIHADPVADNSRQSEVTVDPRESDIHAWQQYPYDGYEHHIIAPERLYSSSLSAVAQPQSAYIPSHSQHSTRSITAPSTYTMSDPMTRDARQSAVINYGSTSTTTTSTMQSQAIYSTVEHAALMASDRQSENPSLTSVSAAGSPRAAILTKGGSGADTMSSEPASSPSNHQRTSSARSPLSSSVAAATYQHEVHNSESQRQVLTAESYTHAPHAQEHHRRAVSDDSYPRGFIEGGYHQHENSSRASQIYQQPAVTSYTDADIIAQAATPFPPSSTKATSDRESASLLPSEPRFRSAHQITTLSSKLPASPSIAAASQSAATVELLSADDQLQAPSLSSSAITVAAMQVPSTPLIPGHLLPPPPSSKLASTPIERSASAQQPSSYILPADDLIPTLINDPWAKEARQTSAINHQSNEATTSDHSYIIVDHAAVAMDGTHGYPSPSFSSRSPRTVDNYTRSSHEDGMSWDVGSSASSPQSSSSHAPPSFTAAVSYPYQHELLNSESKASVSESDRDMCEQSADVDDYRDQESRLVVEESSHLGSEVENKVMHHQASVSEASNIPSDEMSNQLSSAATVEAQVSRNRVKISNHGLDGANDSKEELDSIQLHSFPQHDHSYARLSQQQMEEQTAFDNDLQASNKRDQLLPKHVSSFTVAEEKESDKEAVTSSTLVPSEPRIRSVNQITTLSSKLPVSTANVTPQSASSTEPLSADKELQTPSSPSSQTRTASAPAMNSNSSRAPSPMMMRAPPLSPQIPRHLLPRPPVARPLPPPPHHISPSRLPSSSPMRLPPPPPPRQQPFPSPPPPAALPRHRSSSSATSPTPSPRTALFPSPLVKASSTMSIGVNGKNLMLMATYPPPGSVTRPPPLRPPPPLGPRPALGPCPPGESLTGRLPAPAPAPPSTRPAVRNSSTTRPIPDRVLSSSTSWSPRQSLSSTMSWKSEFTNLSSSSDLSKTWPPAAEKEVYHKEKKAGSSSSSLASSITSLSSNSDPMRSQEPEDLTTTRAAAPAAAGEVSTRLAMMQPSAHLDPSNAMSSMTLDELNVDSSTTVTSINDAGPSEAVAETDLISPSIDTLAAATSISPIAEGVAASGDGAVETKAEVRVVRLSDEEVRQQQAAEDEVKKQEARRRARSFLDLMAGRPLKDLGMIQKHDDAIVTMIPLPDSYTATATITAPTAEAAAAAATTNKPSTATAGAVVKLRPLWRSYLDAKTGATYYHNKVTGETTWEQPDDEAMLLKCLGQEIIYPSDPRYAG